MAAPESPEQQIGSETPAGREQAAGPASLPDQQKPAPGVPRQQQRSLTGKVLASVSIGLGLLYLLNPSAGTLEVIPDVLPLVGNLDEAGATALLLWGLGYFGIDLVRARRTQDEE